MSLPCSIERLTLRPLPRLGSSSPPSRGSMFTLLVVASSPYLLSSTPSIRSRDFLRSTRAASKASWLTVSPLEKASLNLSAAALTACILLSSTPSF